MIGTKMRMSSGATGYNPLTAIGWHSAYWASDPAWSNPGDGNGVASWRDGSGNARTLAQGAGTKQPLYRSADSTLNSRPSVDFDGIDDFLVTSVWTTLTTAFTYIFIGYMTGTVNNRFMMSGHKTDASDYHGPGLGRANATGLWFFSEDAGISGGAANTNPHLFRGYNNNTGGAGSQLAVDESVTNGTVGNARHPSTTMLGSFALNDTLPDAPTDCTCAFAGVYLGDITSDSEWAAFKSWAASFYGLTIA